MVVITGLYALFAYGFSDSNYDVKGNKIKHNSNNKLARRNNFVSAYSVFNEGCQSLLGSIDANELMKQYVGGGGAMGVMAAAARNNNNDNENNIDHQNQNQRPNPIFINEDGGGVAHVNNKKARGREKAELRRRRREEEKNEIFEEWQEE